MTDAEFSGAFIVLERFAQHLNAIDPNDANASARHIWYNNQLMTFLPHNSVAEVLKDIFLYTCGSMTPEMSVLAQQQYPPEEITLDQPNSHANAAFLHILNDLALGLRQSGHFVANNDQDQACFSIMLTHRALLRMYDFLDEHPEFVSSDAFDVVVNVFYRHVLQVMRSKHPQYRFHVIEDFYFIICNKQGKRDDRDSEPECTARRVRS